MVRSSTPERFSAIGLFLLGLAPALFGALRVYWLAGGADVTPETERFFDHSPGMITHILSATLFWILGIFQFSPSFRNNHRHLHKRLGRVWILAASIAALSGLWLSHAMPPGEHDGALLYALRLVVGFSMLICVAFGLRAILRREINSHKAWMMRCYAIGMGAGTQAFIGLPAYLILGVPDKLERALLLGLGWLINILFVEWWLYKKSPVRRADRQKHRVEAA